MIARGFSLLELLVCVVLIAIILVFCTPLGLAILRKNQLELARDELKTIIHFARTTAILEGKPLVLAPLVPDWSRGVRLFVDNPKHQYSENTKLIQQWQWHYQDLQLNWQGFQHANYLVFSPELRHSAVNGHFILQNSKGAAIKLTLNRLGRVKSVKLQNG